MLVMVLGGTFHKTYKRGLLGDFSKNEKHKLGITTYFRLLVHSRQYRLILRLQGSVTVVICTDNNGLDD